MSLYKLHLRITVPQKQSSKQAFPMRSANYTSSSIQATESIRAENSKKSHNNQWPMETGEQLNSTPTKEKINAS